MAQDLAIYTVALGWDYQLPDIVSDTAADFICFTDRDLSPQNGWDIRRVDAMLPEDLFRSSREYKIRPHRWLPDYDRSIYIDSTVHLTAEPNEAWRYLVPNDTVLFGGMAHSGRKNLRAEFAVVQKEQLDAPDILQAQLMAYEKHCPQVLTERPVIGGLLARRHNSETCKRAMEIWFANVMRYSRRDQLSLTVALAEFDTAQKHIVEDNIRHSKIHTWQSGDQNKPPYQKINKDPDVTASDTDGTAIGGTRFSEFHHDQNAQLFYAKDKTTGRKAYVSHKDRLKLYRRGFAHRQDWILRDYQIPKDLLAPGDVFIDVGANVGELGMWANDLGGRYIAFEPDPVANSALQRNTSGEVHDIALSDKNGTAEFFLSTSTADSSLYQPENFSTKIELKTMRLDDFCDQTGLSAPIKLLKLETEGTEPDVLAGAEKTLGRIAFIAVDAGEERDGKNTVPEVLNFLMQRNFLIVSCYLKRGSFFLRNTALG